MKPTSIQTEIISLLHSPELQAYLLASPELLQTTDYAELIAGAPLGLSKKLELLEKLEESLADSEDAELVHIYVECVEDAMEPLEETYEQLFCAQFYAPNDERERSFGPYYVRSWDIFPEIIQEQREADNEAWNIQYWEIKQYFWRDTPDSDSLFGGYNAHYNTYYTYIADPDGDVQYFRLSDYDGETLYGYVVQAFGCATDESTYMERNLPMPYQPGDILEVDSRPYQYGPSYCLILTSGDSGYPARYLYPTNNWGVLVDTLDSLGYERSNFCCQRHIYAMYHVSSPVYHIRRYDGDLPDQCSWMKALSKKIYANPSAGQTIVDLGEVFAFHSH